LVERAAVATAHRDGRVIGHAVLGQDLVHEVPVLLGDHPLQGLGQALLVGEAHLPVGALDGDDDVDAVGLAVDMLVDPLQLQLQLVGRERQGAQDTHASRAADGGGHVSAMGEGEDRELDAEHLAEPVLHI